MIAALFAERNSPEKSSALSAVKLQRGCNLCYTGKQFHTTCRILTLKSKLKLFFLLMTWFNNRWKDFTDISQLTHTYAQTETSRSIEDVAFLALTVLSLISSLDSYTIRGKQNLA